MAKQTNPFFNVDMSKFMTDFDPSKMTEEFANKAAAEGMQKVAERQAEILQDTLTEANKAFDSLGKTATTKDAAGKQAELYQAAFAKALANMQELADMVAKSSTEATEVVNARLAESLDEIKVLAKKMK